MTHCRRRHVLILDNTPVKRETLQILILDNTPEIRDTLQTSSCTNSRHHPVKRDRLQTATSLMMASFQWASSGWTPSAISQVTQPRYRTALLFWVPKVRLPPPPIPAPPPPPPDASASLPSSASVLIVECGCPETGRSRSGEDGAGQRSRALATCCRWPSKLG